MTRTTVLVASPSSINRARAAKLIASVPGYEVIALAADLSETFNAAEIREPDLVVIAEELSQTSEFAVMQKLFDALGTGWILLVGPQCGGSTRPGMDPPATPRIDLSMSPELVAAQLLAVRPGKGRTQRPVVSDAPAGPPVVFEKLVVIGSSTGGIDALLTLLAEFPADCPPTAIVQHTGRGFSDSLVQLLERRCKPNVVAAREGLVLRQGLICVAGGTDGHLTLSPGAQIRCQVRQGPPVSGHVPSIDILFRSAVPMAPHVVGVILTGMGQDGTAGLLDLHRAGAVTIGQDEATSVVYGMPKAAWDKGAVQLQMPIQRIGKEVLRVATANAGKGLQASGRVGVR